MHSYTLELELLVRDTLMPVFDLYYRERGEVPTYTNISPRLLKELYKPVQTPALFKPKPAK